MASIRTHNNRRRSKARSWRQRERDRAQYYMRKYRATYPVLRQFAKMVREHLVPAYQMAAKKMGEAFASGGTITGRFPRPPEMQFIHPSLPRPALMVDIDYSEIEKRAMAHMSGPEAAIDTDIYDELQKKLGMSRADLKDNTLGLLYGMSPQKRAQIDMEKKHGKRTRS